MTNIVIFLIIGIILVIGAIVGYKFIKKRKENTDDHISNNEEAEAEASQGGPSFTSTIGSLMDE
jgi:predicted negative regulator of RcsB-dependent stress response